jgi:hypothetical protein
MIRECEDVYCISLSPEEYFDMEYIEEGEELEADSVAKYWNTIDYIDNDIRSKVNFTKLEIFDNSRDFLYTVMDTYWNEQNYLVRERIDYLRGQKCYHIIIISLTRDDPAVYEIIRLEEMGGEFKPISHTISDSITDENLESYTRGIDEYGKPIRQFLS